MRTQRKICMLGSFGVGKTSMVSQFTHSIFSDKYLTTIGVKIDRKTIQVNDEDLNLVLWDLAGDDRFERIQSSYLSGASGFLLVVDGCRRDSLVVANSILERHAAQLSELPFVCAINKSDLRADWEVGESDIAQLRDSGWKVVLTSAKDGDSVNAAFQKLGDQMMKPQSVPSVEPQSLAATPATA